MHMFQRRHLLNGENLNISFRLSINNVFKYVMSGGGGGGGGGGCFYKLTTFGMSMH